jgi:hypothetical protein
MTIMPAPKEVIELVERFERNLEEYKSSRYKESQLRSEFLNPFFEALGWDVNNKQGYAPAYREVIIEDSLSVGEWTKSPDYCFKIGKERKFFLEAKKPSVNVKEDISPAYQLRRYAWSAKLPLSILSDFEEFAVYDTRIKPIKTNGAKVARIMYFTYKDYIEKWDDIAGIFSREAVLKGSFDKYAETGKKKRGTAEVDDEFLKEIESWRAILAENIANNNPKLSTRELNFAVQNTIDRIIFLRICEDRKIEDYAKLMALQNGENTYLRLCDLFKQADDKYNSGLFHFSEETGRIGQPDTLSLKLRIDDKPLKEIIKGLYYPDSPYQFDYMPVEIIGQVYEQFLGKVIRLKDHHAVIEEKPEVQRAGGVYYTPKYIVDYIVKNTVGKLLEGKTPKQVAKIKILDPACGSGSFLIGAFQYLLDWHREWYEKDGAIEWAKKKSPALYQDVRGGWQLTIAEKKRILLNNIFGVDIDSQAVEVTKLSLLLKVLEGETSQTINTTLRLFHERALPDLGNNIKCGNSLISPDFYSNRQTSFLNEEEKYRVNVFDWRTEFKNIMGEGGFDAVIGNPPYGAFFSSNEMNYLQTVYSTYEYQLNSFALFIEKGATLLRNHGLISYIVPAVYLSQHYFYNLRKYLLNNCEINQLISLNYKVFKDADTGDTSIFVLSKANKISSKNQIKCSVVLDKYELPKLFPAIKLQKEYESNPRLEFIISRHTEVVSKIQERSITLGQIATPVMGIKPYQKGKGRPKQNAHIVANRIFDSNQPLDKSYKKYVVGKDFDRYVLRPVEPRYIKYGEWLAEPRPGAPFEKDKIMVRQTSDIIRGVLDTSHLYNLNNVYNIELKENVKYDYKYILGILNSKLMVFVYQALVPEKGRVFAEIKKVNLDRLPIRPINFSSSEEKQLHNQVVAAVDKILGLYRNLTSIRLPHEKEAVQRQIDTIDKQIDQFVYKLYGLTEEEIGVVEGANDKQQ